MKTTFILVILSCLNANKSSKSRSMAHSKARKQNYDLENENINITIPWDVQLANMLNITTDQLKTNYKNDKNLYSTIASSCSLLRNQSLGQVFKNNNGGWAAQQLKEVCYGKGYAMIEGKMYPLGMCTDSKAKVPKAPVFQDNHTPKNFFGECVTKKNAYVTRLHPQAQLNQNYSSRMERVYSKNYLSGLKLGGLKFIQKAMKSMNVEGHLYNLAGKGYDNVNLNHMSNSLTSIPDYNNPNLNSKGFSFNPTPEERFDNTADYILFNNGAYDSARFSKNAQKKVDPKIDLTKKAIQEEAKALGNQGPGQSFAGTVAGSFVQLKAPEWLCSVVCAGLDVDEVLEDARVHIKDVAPQGLNTKFDMIGSGVQEEQDVLNVNQNQVNSVAYTNNSYTKHCSEILPKVEDCINHGEELSAWMMERLLNPGTMCNYDKGECGQLYEKQ